MLATLTGDPVSAQTVSKLTHELDEAVRQFHSAELKPEWAYRFLDGSEFAGSPAWRTQTCTAVGYAVRHDGTRHRLAFQRSSGESQAAGEGLLQQTLARGLSRDDQATGEGPTGTAQLLPFSANIIERVFVELRRPTRPMVCFVNVARIDRIIYSIFHRFNLEWRNRTRRVFTQAA